MSNCKVLVVEDDAALAEALQDTLSMAGYRVELANDGVEALKQLDAEAFDLVVSDINMPNMDGTVLLKQIKERSAETPVVLMTAYGSIEQAVDAMRDGAVDYLVKPFEAEVLVNMVSRYMGTTLNDDSAMVAVDAHSQQLAKLAKKVAKSDATVMITGESGSGKEVLAQFIHQNSPRREQPFVAINCAAIPENMLEATLFGYEKGAYTGAYKASPGKFEQAQGGTLLLDEISEMDLGLQAKLLRVLQEKEVERLGGNKVIELDVRVLATSNRDMKAVVAEGRFREDLFYRLNVFPLQILPLRERKDDIVPIAERLLEKYSRQEGRAIPQLDSAASQVLLQHEWPGNIRELDNVIQRAMILQQGDCVTADDLHFEVAQANIIPSVGVANPVTQNYSRAEESEDNNTLNNDLKKREWEMILRTIRDKRGSRKETAAILGISQRTLRYKLARMREAGISIPDMTGMEV